VRGGGAPPGASGTGSLAALPLSGRRPTLQRRAATPPGPGRRAPAVGHAVAQCGGVRAAGRVAARRCAGSPAAFPLFKGNVTMGASSGERARTIVLTSVEQPSFAAKLTWGGREMGDGGGSVR